jgi:hypothetical protein
MTAQESKRRAREFRPEIAAAVMNTSCIAMQVFACGRPRIAANRFATGTVKGYIQFSYI